MSPYGPRALEGTDLRQMPSTMEGSHRREQHKEHSLCKSCDESIKIIFHVFMSSEAAAPLWTKLAFILFHLATVGVHDVFVEGDLEEEREDQPVCPDPVRRLSFFYRFSYGKYNMVYRQAQRTEWFIKPFKALIRILSVRSLFFFFFLL